MIPRRLHMMRKGSVETPMPRYGRAGDSGLDLCAAIRTGIWCRWPNGERAQEDRFLVRAAAFDDLLEPVEPVDVLKLPDGASALIPCGWAFEIPLGFEGQVRPRSGLTEERVIVHLGTIDSNYRGELRFLLENRSGRTQAIRTGDRMAQLVIAAVEIIAPWEVQELSPTTRGDQGIGSTGRS